jgi:hypothetical protein
MNLSTFLQEDNGKLSATRLVLLVWVLGLLGVWAAGSLHNIYLGDMGPALLELPPSTITIVGILMAGKVVQKYEEKPGMMPSNTPAPDSVVKKQAEGNAQPASVTA